MLKPVLIVCTAPIPDVVLERNTVLSVPNVNVFAEATAVTPVVPVTVNVPDL